MKRHLSFVAIWLVFHRLVALARAIDTYKLDASANHLSSQDESIMRILCDDCEIETDQTPSVTNPAWSNCVNNHFTYQTKFDSSGSEYGLCIFEENVACEAWAYYQDKCNSTNADFSTYCDDIGGERSKKICPHGIFEDAILAHTYEVCTTSSMMCNEDHYYTNQCDSHAEDVTSSPSDSPSTFSPSVSSFDEGSGSASGSDIGDELCQSEAACHEQSVSMGIQYFYSGHYETKVRAHAFYS
jgi:putative hemolysin